MRTFFSRIWGLRIGWLDIDPVQHLDDPDETPAPAPDVTGRLDADRPPHTPVVAGRMDVPPETRPWDDFDAPPRDPVPMPGGRLAKVPHCDGRHSGEDRCESCDAVTDLITEHKALVARVAELERWVGVIEYRCGHCEEWGRADGPDTGDFYCESCGAQMVLAHCESRPAGQDGGRS